MRESRRRSTGRRGKFTTPRTGLIALLLALAMVVAACGGNGDDASGGDQTGGGGGDTTPSETGSSGGGGGSETAAPEIESLDLQMASFLSPTTAQGEAISWWIDQLEQRTGGKVKVETFWDASLLGAQEIRDGVKDGRVQLGNMTYAYTPSDFPLSSIVEVPFLGDNIGAEMVALNSMYANNENFRNEWENQGIKVMSFVGIPGPLTGAKEEVDSIDWFKGKTVRSSGFYTKALEAIGANPAAIPVTDVYEAMQRGTIDAYGGLILDVITPLSLQEVGPFIHDAGLGHYASSTWTMSLDTWNSLSPALQSIIEDLNAEFPDQLVAAAKKTEDAACQKILADGGGVNVWTEAETQRWADAIGDAPLNDWIAKAEGAGVADGQSMYDEFTGYFQDAEQGQYADYQTGPERCVAMEG
jgi:TRAP-type C4-dicarboxylate transport system substrate-binding protein